MKKYKLGDHNLIVMDLENFLASNYMFESMKLLKKKYENITYSHIIRLDNTYQKYILIINNNKLIGFIYGVFDMDLHIHKFVLNLNKDLVKKIIRKLEKIFKFVMITLRVSDKKLINTLMELNFKEWNSIKQYQAKAGLDKGCKKIVLFNWNMPNKN